MHKVVLNISCYKLNESVDHDSYNQEMSVV